MDYRKGELRDNLKVISIWFFYERFSKTEFPCSLAAVFRGGGEDRRMSGDKMFN